MIPCLPLTPGTALAALPATRSVAPAALPVTRSIARAALPVVWSIALAGLLAATGCSITETGLTCNPTCVTICDAPREVAFFSAEVVATGDDGRVRLTERLGGGAEVDLAAGDEIAHGALWVEVAPGDAVIVTIARGASGEPEAVAGAFPLDGDDVLCSDSNPQDPDIPLPVDDYMLLAGTDGECRADLEGRGIPIECEDTP